MTLNTFQQWQVANGHHVTENIDGDEFHAPELCPLCQGYGQDEPDEQAIADAEDALRREYDDSVPAEHEHGDGQGGTVTHEHAYGMDDHTHEHDEVRTLVRVSDERYARTIGENILRGSLPDVDYDAERALWSLRAIIAVLDAERVRAHEAVYAARQAEKDARRAG